MSFTIQIEHGKDIGRVEHKHLLLVYSAVSIVVIQSSSSYKYKLFLDIHRIWFGWHWWLHRFWWKKVLEGFSSTKSLPGSGRVVTYVTGHH